MKKALMLVLALVISVAFVTTVFAQAAKEAAPAAPATAPAKAPEKPATDKAPKAKKAVGEVVKISEEEGIIVVKGKKGEDAYDIKDVKWKVYKNGKEVKAGEIVAVSYLDKDGKKVATVVAKVPPKKKAAPAEKKADAPAPPAAPAPAGTK
jgi:hypothetical protein